MNNLSIHSNGHPDIPTSEQNIAEADKIQNYTDFDKIASGHNVDYSSKRKLMELERTRWMYLTRNFELPMQGSNPADE
jgi:hypothetical protein